MCYNRDVMVTVRLFASYREAAGKAVVEVSLEDGAGGQALWKALVARYPALASLPAPAGYAVNDEYVRDLLSLRESDKVALIPPVSGGDGRPPLIELTDRMISVDRVLQEAADPQAGAVVLFLGTVRDNARGRSVHHLTYESYEILALKEMQKIAAIVSERWPITRVVIVHRTGRLQVGDISVAIGVSAPHRAEAFDAGRFAIDTLKTTVPIWKKEVWEGGEAWVGIEPRPRTTSR